VEEGPVSSFRRWLVSPFVRLHRDERGLLVSFVVRFALVIALMVLAVEEGGQILLAQIHAGTAARTAAQAAANTFHTTHSEGRAEDSAVKAARDFDPKAQVLTVVVHPDETVTVTVMETAKTLVVHRVGFLKDFGQQQATQQESFSF
jgi:Flp pilus assembly protein TadG